MTTQELCTELEKMLQLSPGAVQPFSTLASLKGWDSIAAIEFMALADAKLGVSVPADRVARAKTVAELVALLEGKVTA